MNKLCVLICYLTLLTSACKKDRGISSAPAETPPDYTSATVMETVNSEIIGYVTDDELKPLYGRNMIFHKNNGFYITDGKFNTGPLSTDKYNTTLKIESGGSADNIEYFKSIPVTSALKNYSRLVSPKRSEIGTVANENGGALTTAGSGILAFGINSLYYPGFGTNPGYFTPGIISRVYLTFFNPENPEFPLRVPSGMTADDGGKRWFLKSYGAMNLYMYSYNANKYVDFSYRETALYKLPIQPGMLAAAPDSLITWRLDNGVWRKAGVAKKVNNFYEARIDKATAWNFAAPVNGVYLTVKVRSDSNASFTNATVRIKSAGMAVAESQTDADGNAVCFVPANEPLTAEVIPGKDINTNRPYRFNIDAVKSASDVTFTFPTGGPFTSTLTGFALNCNGEPVKKGVARITMHGGREYFIPVNEGKFTTAVWIYAPHLNTGDVHDIQNRAKVQITDVSTNLQGQVTNIILLPTVNQRMNFYSCLDSAVLYCNYTVDNKHYQLRDHAASPNVYMTATKAGVSSDFLFKMSSNNTTGINFSSWAYLTGVWTSRVENIVVNGVAYAYDASKSSYVSYSTLDAAVGGYIEGWFSFNYLDKANVSHHVNGNFKVKKTF